MRYEWDDSKNQANKAKHGVGFEEMHDYRWDSALLVPDERKNYGEPRWIAIGFIGARLHTLVYTLRDGNTRVISLRKSNSREEVAYESQKG